MSKETFKSQTSPSPSPSPAEPPVPQQFTAVNNTGTSSGQLPNGTPVQVNSGSPAYGGGSDQSAINLSQQPHTPPVIFSSGSNSNSSRSRPTFTQPGLHVEINNSSNHVQKRSEDRSPMDFAHAGPPPIDENWQPSGVPSDSTNGIQKRKRSITPTTQTQHHHLAAHEAAMGPTVKTENTTCSKRPADDDTPTGDDTKDASRSVRQRTNDANSPRAGPSTPAVASSSSANSNANTETPPEPKKRIRVFSNRTKTGCITCRRRKKKCDEDKPECNNCTRGGFVCEGYSGKVNWQKPGSKQQLAQSVAGPPYIQSKDEQQPGTVSTAAAATTPTPARRGNRDDRMYVARPEEALVVQDPGAPAFMHPANDTANPANVVVPNGADRHQSFPNQPAATATSGSSVRVRTEKEKMLNSELYHARAPELVAERAACRTACWRYNQIAANPDLGISDAEKGRLLLNVLRPGNKWDVVNTGAAQPGTTSGLAYVSENGYTSDIIDVTVDAPFNCSYGYNIRLGKNVYIEFGCTILDSCSVTIKARTILSPGVSIYSATHPIDPRKRNGSMGPEMAKPVLIEEDCWLGGNVIVLGGITIGKGSVVGAGSVVTRDVPPFTVVAGNPARVVRGIYQNGIEV